MLAERVVPSIEAVSAMDAARKENSPIRLANTSGVKTRIAMCCSPIPGEDISGYITKTSYASIHKSYCPNMERLRVKNPDRTISASWQSKSGTNFVKLKIAAFDRVGLLQEISSSISNMGINILSISADRENELDAKFQVVAEVFDINQLRMLILNLEKIKSVKKVSRA